MKPIVILAKIQSAREASHHVNLMDNCQKFYSRLCFCVRILKVVAVA